MPVRRGRSHLLTVSLISLLLLSSSLAGCQALGRLNEVLYPSATPAGATVGSPEPSETALQIPAPTLSASLPATTTEPVASAVPTAAPQPASQEHLVFYRGTSLYRGDYFGLGPVEVATGPQLDNYAFSQGRIAIAQGRNVDVIDLAAGTLRSFQIKTDAKIEYAEVHWGNAGQVLLHVALVPDETAKTMGRNVELRGLNPSDGAELFKVVEADANGATILRYDEAAGQILVIPHGPEPTFSEVEYLDVRTGQLVGAYAAQGEGDAFASPNGHYLLTQRVGDEGAELLLYDLTSKSGGQPLVWKHPQSTHSVSAIWSPDGRYVAYLLRQGRSLADESTQAAGLWVLDVTTMHASKILDESLAASSLVGWAPDGAYLLGQHRGTGEDVYYYAIRPDGSDGRKLEIGAEATILGWMPVADGADIPKVVMDPWRARFLSAADDTAATAGVVAQFVAGQPKAADEALTQQVSDYLARAGWKSDVAGPEIKRVTAGLYLAQLPPMSIFALQDGQAQPLTTGHLLLDARQEGQDLGLIFGMIGANAVQPAYLLLREQADGTWVTVWNAQGEQSWVATDGEIRFVGKGLTTLHVSGTSLGLDAGPEEVFAECHACPQRKLAATWTRKGDVYVRQSKLAAGAPLHDALWEMTEKTPYAVLHEVLWRLRHDRPADDLVTDPGVLAQIQELGLLSQGARLMPEQDQAHAVLFMEATSGTHFSATVERGRILHIERIK